MVCLKVQREILWYVLRYNMANKDGKCSRYSISHTVWCQRTKHCDVVNEGKTSCIKVKRHGLRYDILRVKIRYILCILRF